MTEHLIFSQISGILQETVQRYRSGHNGADSKSVCRQLHVGSNPTRCATSEQATYRLLRLFQKSERAHCAAPPFQIEPASLGFDLVLGAISKENRFYPLIARRSKVRFAPAIFYKNHHPLHSRAPPLQTGPAPLGSGLGLMRTGKPYLFGIAAYK